MKLLIIGASGFIGSHIQRFADHYEFETVGTRVRSTNDRHVRFDLRNDRIGDCVPEDFFGREGVCAIIAAGISKIDECRRDSAATRLVNVEKTILLIDDLVERGAIPVFLSTSCVFDGRAGYYNERDKPSPINEYGRQKLEVEQYLLKRVSNSLILRLDKVVGDNPAESHLLSDWYRQMQKGEPVECIAGQILSPTLVDDIIARVLFTWDLVEEMTGLYHVANTEFFSRDELACQFARACGFSAEILVKPMEEFKFSDPRPIKTYLDCSKFMDANPTTMTSMHTVFQRFLAKVRGESNPGGESR